MLKTYVEGFANIFPTHSVPKEVTNLFPCDISWENDECPSFESDALRLIIFWCDSPDSDHNGWSVYDDNMNEMLKEGFCLQSFKDHFGVK